MVATIALPRFEDSRVVVPAPGYEPGNWAGAASAVLVDGEFWLAYRVRRPLGKGRGVSVVICRSTDGEHFRAVAEIFREEFRAESFERPVVLRKPDGGWRLYLSCATPGSKHWWIEAVDARHPTEFGVGTRRRVLSGSEKLAVKDPVVVVDENGWRMWVCCHPLSEPGQEDRMTTALATSDDGLSWTWQGEVLRPTPGSWDQRGTRVTAVISESPLVVLYDGRASRDDNWHEVTGVARADESGVLVGEPEPLVRSPHSDGAFRYVAAVPLPDGGTRFYFEAARPDGAHDLMTSVSPA
jgi:hypothetical protein